jgi:SAM-dependent methyltransferase
MKKYLSNLYEQAANFNRQNILNLFEENNGALFLDLGCDDGVLTRELAKKINTNNLYGVEIIDEQIKIAEKNGIVIKNFDLNKEFNLESDYFDIIHANQVIEHLYNSDNFISEIYRVLKPGGYAIISTENASSWCNVFASIMGWQIFSLTNISLKKRSIGNPFSIHREDKPVLFSWNHIRVYNINGLKEYLEAFGFKIEDVKGAGYFPLPALFGNLDKTHSHFMTFKIRK